MEKTTSTGPGAARTSVRWMVLLFLFLATVLLYTDRAALGIMAPFLQKEIGWSEQQYGNINTAFMIGYAICFLLMGSWIDRIGTRNGYPLAVGLWATAQAATALAGSWIGFALARFGLSVGQSGNFPVANKVLAEWFPRKERALAVGLFNGGSNVGTIISPIVIPVVVTAFGNKWQAAFLWTLPLSALWIALWMLFYRNPASHRMVNRKELDHISSDSAGEPAEKISWPLLLRKKELWGVCAGKFIADPIWWFYLFWGAKFLNTKYGLDLREIGPPFFTVYLLSWVGGILIGWLSSALLRKGWSVNNGRKTALLVCAFCALPVALVPHLDNIWIATGLLALAAGGHCGWSANIFSLISDIFPKETTASVTGIGGFAGAAGGAIIAQVVGRSLQNMGPDGYFVPFIIASLGYLAALGIIQLLIPRIKPLNN